MYSRPGIAYWGMSLPRVSSPRSETVREELIEHQAPLAWRELYCPRDMRYRMVCTGPSVGQMLDGAMLQQAWRDLKDGIA